MRIINYTYPVSRSPYSGLEGEINRLFSSAFADFAGSTRAVNPQFAVDLYEDNDNAYVRAELPGVTREDIGVELVDGTLTIQASRRQPSANGGESTSFSRSLSVPGEIQADKVAAAYENGVLTVTLPKKEESKPRKITVSVK